MIPNKEFKNEQRETPLAGDLAEFRTALEKEIRAAKQKASSSAVPLSNGRKIAQIGESYQYLFTIDSFLNVPGDTPGDLIVPGKGSFETIIISVEGLNITLSVTLDLGAFVPEARLLSDLTMLMRKLIERIENLNGKENPAGDRILGKQAVMGSPEPIEYHGDLNDEQKKALESSLGSNITFIWGPPGTGKTKTIGAIGEQLFQRDRSILLVSHTNTAVDHALLNIAEAVDPDLVEANLIRVGEPKDDRLRKKHPELLLTVQVAKRSEELIAQKERIELERADLKMEIIEIQRKIDIYEWAREAQVHIDAMEKDLLQIKDMDIKASRLLEKEKNLLKEVSRLEVIVNAARNALAWGLRVTTLTQEIDVLGRNLTEWTKELYKFRSSLEEAEQIYNKAKEADILRGKLSALPTRNEQETIVGQLKYLIAKNDKDRKEVASKLEEAERFLEKAEATGAIMRAWKKLPNPNNQRVVVNTLRKELSSKKESLANAEKELDQNEGILKDILNLENELKAFSSIPDAMSQFKRLESIRKNITKQEQKVAVTIESHKETREELEKATAKIEEFQRTFHGEPKDLLNKAQKHMQDLKKVRAQRRAQQKEGLEKRYALETLLKERISVLNEWDICDEQFGSAETMLAAVQAAHTKAIEESEGIDINELSTRQTEINERIKKIVEEINDIEESLKRVEELVIAEAKIVATTLTRAYLRDSVQTRRFDTVIIDEASMASIPALWVTASLSDNNIIVVGDFKQLPPIVQSDDNLAKKWLGRDIFKVSGMQDLYEQGCVPQRFVSLCLQFRMNPDISAVPNNLFYDGRLKDDESVTESTREQMTDEKLGDWYRYDWGYDNPVLLVDTESTEAWVDQCD